MSAEYALKGPPPPKPKWAQGALAAATRQALLNFGRHGCTLQEGLDCAELLAASGHADASNAICLVMSLETGRPIETEVPGALGYYAPKRTVGLDGMSAGSSIEIAVAQLRLLHALADDLETLPADGREIMDIRSATNLSGPGQNWPQKIPTPEELASWCIRLAAVLSRPFDRQGRDELHCVLTQIWSDVLDGLELDVSRHVGAALPILGGLVAAQRLRHFLLKVADLACAPFGSLALVHAAANLDQAGLGPWLSNTNHVIRNPRDVFALVQLALCPPDRGGVDEDPLERWSFLLSLQMPDAAWRDMIDELADEGLFRAIWGALERTARLPQTDISVLWCIRDAGLDLGDYDLAVRAQRLVIERDVLKANEWILLGRLEATAGNLRLAEEAFLHGLELDPGDVGGRDNLGALRRGAIDEIEVISGFGGSSERRRVRARWRREARSAQDDSELGTRPAEVEDSVMKMSD